MVQHKPLVWISPHYITGNAKMPGEEEQIVSQPKSLQLAQAIQETFPQHEIVVRFVMDDMSDAAEFWVLSKLLKLLDKSIAAQVDPAHNGADKGKLVRELQKPSTLFDALSSLDCNRTVNASAVN